MIDVGREHTVFAPLIVEVAEFGPHDDLLPEETERRHAVYGAAVEFLADEGLREPRRGGRALFSSKGLAVAAKDPRGRCSPHRPRPSAMP
ncbi:MAG: hypothetical protein ACREXR_12420 [Gammaproteobacteria bacterium]